MQNRSRRFQWRWLPGPALAEYQYPPGNRALLRRVRRGHRYRLEFREPLRRAQRLGAGGRWRLRWQRRAGPGMGIHADRASDGELLWGSGRHYISRLELPESNGGTGLDGGRGSGYEQRRGTGLDLAKQHDESNHGELLRRCGRRGIPRLELAQQRRGAGGLARSRSGGFRWQRDAGSGMAIYADAASLGELLRGCWRSGVSGLGVAQRQRCTGLDGNGGQRLQWRWRAGP